MQTAQQPKIGLLNDLHYDGGVQSMNRLYESVAVLNQGNIGHLLVLGDLVDATNEGNAKRLLHEVSALCDSFHGTVHYLPGNHDLDHLSKAQFFNELGCAGDSARCRFASEGVTCICIDGNYTPDGTEYDNGNFTWEKSCVPEEQVAWLREQLEAAAGPVLLFSHQRIDVAGDYAIQNHAEVREVIRQSGKVKAVFQGHQHADDLKQIDGTAYYTLAAHKDDAGPAVVHIDPQGIRLVRDFQSLEPA